EDRDDERQLIEQQMALRRRREVHDIDAVADQGSLERRPQLQPDLDEVERPAIFEKQEDVVQDAEFQQARLDPELPDDLQGSWIGRIHDNLIAGAGGPAAQPQQVVERLLESTAYLERLLQHHGKSQRSHDTVLLFAMERWALVFRR